MTAFEIAQERHAVFSDHLRSLIRGCRIDDAARRSPAGLQGLPRYPEQPGRPLGDT